jgi:malonyl-CoA/methylmalonyl-CoA synthetase
MQDPRPGPDRHLPPGTAAPAAPTTSLTAAWEARWAADGARAVLHDPGVGWMSAASLEEHSAAAARHLLAAGLGPGDRVLLSAGSSVAAVVAFVGALRAGLVVVPANTQYREAEVAHIARDAGVRAAVVDDAARGRWVVDAAPGRVLVTSPEELAALPITEGAGPSGGDRPALGPADPGVLLYTSGTTGVPKGAPLSHGNLLAGAEALRLAWRWAPEDRLVHALPLFHLHGLGAGINGTLLAGASAMLRPRFDAADVLACAGPDGEGATLFFGVPTMYARLAESPLSSLEALAGLRLCVSGSAPLPPDLFAAIEAASGQRILERYGMTETMLTVSNPYAGERRPGTVGFPLPGVELRLAEGTGEVEVRGPTVFAGYWQRPDATAEAFTADGWFRSGDIGEFDEAGYLRIAGRTKELIITGGYNVYPREVEEALRRHPAVADVAVAGVPSDVWGEAVTAWVVPADDVTADALLAFARTTLAPYKCPKDVRFLDTLPRNALGKVLKHALP